MIRHIKNKLHVRFSVSKNMFLEALLEMDFLCCALQMIACQKVGFHSVIVLNLFLKYLIIHNQLRGDSSMATTVINSTFAIPTLIFVT